MKILFDALAATARSGGMRLHATETIRAWSEAFPDDEIHAVAPRWASGDLSRWPVIIHRWGNESISLRAPGQILYTAVVARCISADAIISLSPVVTPFGGHRSRVAFQHDWRHIKAPNQFSLAQRVYRHLWTWSARWATFNACISAKAERETLEQAPSARTLVVPNGADHVKRWGLENVESVPGRIVTFGHHNNKRPELLIDAMATLDDSLGATLVVLGATNSYKEKLEQRASLRGVADRVTFPGFVSEHDYQRILASAAMVALMSSDEGFGLPVAEASFLGIPAMIAADGGIREVFGGCLTVAAPDPESCGEAMATIIAGGSSRRRLRTGLSSWSAGASQLRSALVCRPSPDPGKQCDN